MSKYNNILSQIRLEFLKMKHLIEQKTHNSTQQTVIENKDKTITY